MSFIKSFDLIVLSNQPFILFMQKCPAGISSAFMSFRIDALYLQHFLQTFIFL